MATMRPSATTKASRPMTWPSSSMIDAGGAVDQRRAQRRQRPREHDRVAGDGLGAADDPRRRGAAGVAVQHDVGVEHGHQAVEVAGPGGAEEGVDDRPLPGEVGLGRRRRLLHLAPGAAGELAGGGRRLVEDRGDLLERDGEAVVQHEGHPFRRWQGLQHGHQRHADGIGEQRLVLGLHGVGPVDDGVGHVDLQRLVGVGAAAAQDVEADAGDDRGQPRGEVLDLVGRRRAAAAARPPARRRRPRRSSRASGSRPPAGGRGAARTARREILRPSRHKPPRRGVEQLNPQSSPM